MFGHVWVGKSYYIYIKFTLTALGKIAFESRINSNLKLGFEVFHSKLLLELNSLLRECDQNISHSKLNSNFRLETIMEAKSILPNLIPNISKSILPRINFVSSKNETKHTLTKK